MNSLLGLPPYVNQMASRPLSTIAKAQFNSGAVSNAHELSGIARRFCGFSLQAGPVQGLPMVVSHRLNDPKPVTSACCAIKGA